MTSEPQARNAILNDLRSAASESDERKAASSVRLLLQRLRSDTFAEVVDGLQRFDSSHTWSEQIFGMGKICVALAKILLSLFIPAIPVDPEAILMADEKRRTHQADWLKGQLFIHNHFESVSCGRSSNIFTIHLEEGLQQLSDIRVSNSMPEKRRAICTPLRIQAFWREVTAFTEDIIQSKRLQLLYTASNVEDVVQLETLLQDSASNFLQRMDSVYEDVEDLVVPVELALSNFRFGIRALRHAKLLQTSSLRGSWRTQVLAFPSCKARRALSITESLDLGLDGTPIAHTILIKLLSEVYSRGRQSKNVRTIRSLLDSLLSLWKNATSRRTEEQRASSSLYRSKEESENTEEENVRLMFPTFHEEHEESTFYESNVSRRHFSEDLPDNLGLDIMVIQDYCFASDERADAHLAMDQLWETLKTHLLSTFSDQDFALMSCSVDDESLVCRLELLKSLSKEFESGKDADCSTVDFYRSANLLEARNALGAVERLQDQLRVLIRKWPEQLVLQHLKDRCASICSMAMNSPVAKLLGAFEQLLAHTEDWEMFADSANSLAPQRQDLVSMIVHWRKMELDNWRSILLSEQKEHCRDLGEWWFKLYEATVEGSYAASSESELSLDTYLDSLAPLLSDFLSSADQGQFSARLKMIFSFSRMTGQFADNERGSSSNGLRRISQILSNIHGFYSQFERDICASFMEETRKLEKEVQNLAKIAIWKDVNVHALRQSAQRTHKQLYRRIRCFRELLRQSVSSHLHTGKADVGKDLRQFEIPVKASTVTFGTSVNGTRVFKKFDHEMSLSETSICGGSARQRVEDLSAGMASSQQEFSKLVPPQGLPKADRKRWVSSALNQKRRAWTDFQKEMRVAGFSKSVKAEVSLKHRKLRLLMDQIIFPSQGISYFPVLEQAEVYFYHATEVLTLSIENALSHNNDLTGRDVQRSLSLLETTYNYAQTSRERYASSFLKFDSLIYLLIELQQ